LHVDLCFVVPFSFVVAVLVVVGDASLTKESGWTKTITLDTTNKDFPIFCPTTEMVGQKIRMF